MVVLLALLGFKTLEPLNRAINSSINQEGLIVYATYNSHQDANYNFVAKDRNSEEQVLAFQKIYDSELAAFDLNAVTFVGTMFKITFNQDDDESRTITKLENL